jgi:GNAT superfamily N-acetyltransferase
MNIRHANLPHDYPGIADVLQAEMGDWAATADELAYDDAVRDPALHWARFVAENDTPEATSFAGIATVEHDRMAHRDGKFAIDIRVRPELQGRGIGAALYQALLEHLGPLAPHELQTDVWETHPRAVRFVTERGFVESWRRIDSFLDVTGFDFAPYASLDERIRARGVTVTTFAALADDPTRIKKLYDLDGAIWRDIPYGQAVTRPTLTQFEKEFVQAPHFLLDACFIAVHDGAFVGYSALLQGDGYLMIDITGVLQAYRNIGLATLLKLESIRYAQAHGNLQLRTVNDSVNAPILALNAKLGFQCEGATIRFVKGIRG